MAIQTPSGIAQPTRLMPAFLLSAVSAALMVVAAVPGAFTTGFYHDTASVIATNRGSDLLTLFVVVPVLLVSLAYSARGSLRGQMVWLGVTGWTGYNYTVYAFGLQFTPMFLVYVAILSLAVFVLAIAIRRVDVAGLAPQFGPVPRRIVAGYLFLVAGIFSMLWLSDAVPATVGGGVPKRLVELQSTSNPVEVIDLAVIIPTLVLAGVWTWMQRPVGYLLAGILLGVATVTLGVIVPGRPIFGGLAIEPIYPAVAALSLALLIAVLATTKPAANPPRRTMSVAVGTPTGA